MDSVTKCKTRRCLRKRKKKERSENKAKQNQIGRSARKTGRLAIRHTKVRDGPSNPSKGW